MSCAARQMSISGISRESCTVVVDKGLRPDPTASQDGGGMAPILTSEDVRRIAAECTFVDERGAVGIRLEPAAATIRRYGEPFRAPWRQRRPRSAKPPPLLRALSGQ